MHDLNLMNSIKNELWEEKLKYKEARKEIDYLNLVSKKQAIALTTESKEDQIKGLQK